MLRTELATGSVLPVLLFTAITSTSPIVTGTRSTRDAATGLYVARSRVENGIHFDVLCAIDKADMDAESLERPALDVTPDGDWDLYLSCATFNSKHWRIERLRARRPEDFSARTRQIVFPGSRAFGIKDPVLVRGQDLRVWATLHPLTEGDDNADKMTSVDA